MKDLNLFSRELNCYYKGEKYLVRDNGAVLRQPPEGKGSRNNDGTWTFGTPNKRTGYLELSSVPIHSIVATAFHGQKPTVSHVVDHINADILNNRPENLRWLTKLVNLLLDPITAKRIAKLCGTVEAFLSNAERFRDKFKEKKFEWVGKISTTYAHDTLKDLMSLAQIETLPSAGALDRWLVNRLNWLDIEEVEPPSLVTALTTNAVQRDWNVPSEFPCCPQQYNGEPLAAYCQGLANGAVFCNNRSYCSTVIKSAHNRDLQSIFIITENKEGVKRYGLAKVTHENNLFVHTSLGTFITEEGAEKQFCLAQGLNWSDGDTIDDLIG